MNPESLKTPIFEDSAEPSQSPPSVVLLIDDDRSTHGVIESFFSGGNFLVKHAYSAAQARAELKKHKIDIVLCDIGMPDEDGLSFCRETKRQRHESEIPFVFLTTKADAKTMQEAVEAGADDYIAKPIRIGELLTRCRRLVDEYRARKQAEKTISSLHQQNASKTKFLSVASHDLRNPIASICGVSHFLETERFGKLNESQREMVRCIIEASENMLNLVEDLLDVSKIDLDRFELSKESVQVSKLVSQVAKLQLPLAEKKSIKISHVDRSAKAASSIDRRLITRCIENLTTNAIKFSPKATAITLETRSDQSFIYISVKDEGPGIPEGEFDKLFKEFSRTSNMPTGGESTSGIGLYVVKRIVDCHAGEISVNNLPQGGAHFQIKLQRIP